MKEKIKLKLKKKKLKKKLQLDPIQKKKKERDTLEKLLRLQDNKKSGREKYFKKKGKNVFFMCYGYGFF